TRQWKILTTNALGLNCRRACVMGGKDQRALGQVEQPRPKRAIKRLTPFFKVPAEVWPTDAIRKKRVARKKISLADQVTDGLGRVTGSCQDLDRNACGPHVQHGSVGKWPRVQASPDIFSRGDEVFRATAPSERGASTHVIGVDMRVEDTRYLCAE